MRGRYPRRCAGGRVERPGAPGSPAWRARPPSDATALLRAGGAPAPERDARVALFVHRGHALAELAEAARVGQVLVRLAGDVGAWEPGVLRHERDGGGLVHLVGPC